MGSHAYFVVCLESETVRVDFSNANATVQKVTATIATTTKMSAWLLNSGTVGLEDTDVPETSDIHRDRAIVECWLQISRLCQSHKPHHAGRLSTVTFGTTVLLLSRYYRDGVGARIGNEYLALARIISYRRGTEANGQGGNHGIVAIRYDRDRVRIVIGNKDLALDRIISYS